jgi:ribulose-phosphate 3-epimerase
VGALEDILPFVDLVLVMTVNPGFGGQRFIANSLRKIAALRDALARLDVSGIEVEVDGGIAPETAGAVVHAGATVLVAGAAVFNERASVATNVTMLRNAAA